MQAAVPEPMYLILGWVTGQGDRVRSRIDLEIVVGLVPTLSLMHVGQVQNWKKVENCVLFLHCGV